jgi:hypothetical protein
LLNYNYFAWHDFPPAPARFHRVAFLLHHAMQVAVAQLGLKAESLLVNSVGQRPTMIARHEPVRLKA